MKNDRTIEIRHSTLGQLKVKLADLTTTTYDLDTDRSYQSDIIINHLSKYQHSLTVCPTGSGKSIIIVADAARHSRNAIIATPKLSINSGFVRLNTDRFEAICGTKTYRLRRDKVQTPFSDKASELNRLLCSTGRSIIVCSHASLANFLSGRLSATTKAELANTVIYLDEAHHSDIDAGNMLGTTVNKCLKLCYSLHAFTATPFRTNGAEILNGEFVHWRRTLKEHHEDRQCPDFSIHVRFYEKVKASKYDTWEPTKKSSRCLIDSYVEEYRRNSKHYTLMVVDSRDESAKLARRLKKEFPKKRLVNLGSDDGKTLVSEMPSSIANKRYNQLKEPDNTDIVIAIKMMDEGSDWPDCSQTFSPRVSASLQLVMQRAIGRALRKKRNDHPYRHKSRIVFFEIGVDSEDKHKAAPALFQFAVRLKALCDGIDFVDDYKLKLPKQQREKLDKEKQEFKDNTDTQINHDVLSEIIEMHAAGASHAEMVTAYTEMCEERGIQVSEQVALELLIAQKIIPANNGLAKFISRMERSGITWKELLEDEEFQELLEQSRLDGVASYMKLLGVKGTMKKIADILQRHVNGSAWEKKQILLEMAKNGEPRPTHKHPLGMALGHYICETSTAYDSEFDELICKSAPRWFENTAAIKKQQLIEMAKNGEPRPTHKHPLGRVLAHYIGKGSTAYDSEFDELIRKLAPRWFEDTVAIKKQQLIEMAKNGEPRPHSSKHPLGGALSNYTGKSNSSYDSEFDELIRKLAPKWFENQTDTAANKKQLIEMAKNGEPRPVEEKHPLGRVLGNYTRKSSGSYDSDFDKKIRKLTPKWFVNQTEKAAIKKQQLIEMAKNGEPKPHSSKHQLGIALGNYTRKSNSSYDPVFDKKIRKLAPHWFKR